MQEQKIQDQILGFRSQLDLETQKALIQKLIQDQADRTTAKWAQVILESLSKDLESERERLQKITSENTAGKPLEDQQQYGEQKPYLEERKTDRGTLRAKLVVAIDEKELNKVELAYFKRPKDFVILSDKDASRLMKGQDVHHLHNEKDILRDYNVQLNGNIPAYNYDGDSGQDNDKKNFVSNNQVQEFDPEIGSNKSESGGEKYNGVGGSLSRKSNGGQNPQNGFSCIKRSGSGGNAKNSTSKGKSVKKLVGTKRTHPMSEGGSQEDDRSNKEGDTDSIIDEPNPGPKHYNEMNKKLYCICQQEYKNGNLMFQCEGPCEGWYHPHCMNLPPERVEELKNSKEPWICDFCQNYVLINQYQKHINFNKQENNMNESTTNGQVLEGGKQPELGDSAGKRLKKKIINQNNGGNSNSNKSLGPISNQTSQ
ncbi:set1 complex component spp1 [Stylonychia lemnae]|uniref:Set1 complex component spp1 n=1 Tax=Stylonychia lemnae TaxID=5949 RepID=A0A078B1R2_STYLE|nr:set1 complex component spp1 [Stylonychia lemnae]|eukprot:CDW88241.1 set1 complex component spp1 [Stylonychia lemnae]